jgi:hypothetical protein
MCTLCTLAEQSQSTRVCSGTVAAGGGGGSDVSTWDVGLVIMIVKGDAYTTVRSVCR